MEYAIHTIKKQIIDLIDQSIKEEFDLSKIEITVPPNSEMGDLAVPCFYLSKVTRQAPNKIAEELAYKIRPGGIISEVKSLGPYLNIFINPGVLASEVIKEIQQYKENYGKLKIAKERVMIEYSSPNTHKEFHIGHARNVALGGALINLRRFIGQKVIPVNYIGDIGAHVAKCIWALEKFHAGEDLPKNKGKYLGAIYSEAVTKIEANPDFKKEAHVIQQKLESGDKKLVALWKKTRKWSLEELEDIYKLLGAEFEHNFYESEVEKPGKELVEKLLKSGIAERSQGAVIINLEEYDLKNLLLLKSDGSSLYSTKELALADLKFKKYKIDESITLTDSRQSFYFSQIFKTLEVIGFDKKLTHVPYEFVTLREGAMSSRAGNIIAFEDFYDSVVERAKAETKKRHDDWTDKKLDEVARKIAISAIKFNMLKVGNNSIIVFDIDEALSFDGFSGSYVQYTCSRINSVLQKAKFKGAIGDVDKLSTDLEKELLLKLASFPEVVKSAATNNDPSEIAKYVFDLSRMFSTFYQQVSIINSPEGVKEARLALVDSIRKVLVNGLAILGIEPLDQM